MSKSTRWILFYFAVIVFLALSYGVVVHALGYKYDIVQRTFVQTGSFRVVVNAGASVYINDALAGSTSFLGKDFSKGRLLPRVYSVKLERDGYYPYQKNISVVAGLFTDMPKVVLLPMDLRQEKIATESFGFPITDSKVRVDKERVLTFDEHEISVEWTGDTDYQPFHKTGDTEVILRLSNIISDVQWYRDHDHILVSSGGILSFYEIDKRGGINAYEISSINGPFYYDPDENSVYLMKGSEIVRMTL